MKIICQKSTLQEVLKLTARGVKRNSPIPALPSIKLATDPEIGLSLTATDYEMEIHCRAGCQVEAPGAIALPARAFLEIIGSAPGSEITIEVTEGWQATIRSGRSRHRLQGMDAAEFPALPDTEDEVGLLLPQCLLREMFAFVAHAVATDETRPIMTGAHLWIEGQQGRLVATDTHRLANYDLAFDEPITPSVSAIIPKRTLTEMLHFLALDEEEEPVDLRIDASQIEFRMPFHTVKSRLVAGAFPKVQSVIELVRNHPHDITLPRTSLVEAIKRVDILAREELHQIAWQVTGQVLSLSAQVAQVGDSAEDLEIVNSYAPEDIRIWFRADQLLAALQALTSETVTMVYECPTRPVLLFPGDASHFEILMPLVPPTEGTEASG